MQAELLRSRFLCDPQVCVFARTRAMLTHTMQGCDTAVYKVDHLNHQFQACQSLEDIKVIKPKCAIFVRLLRLLEPYPIEKVLHDKQHHHQSRLRSADAAQRAPPTCRVCTRTWMRWWLSSAFAWTR